MRLGLITFAVLCANAAFADDIAGLTADDFVATKELWLSGSDDAAALAALSELANAQNRAAQILLARIETRPVLHSHITSTLERADRIALLRKPGGLSGKSWMTDAMVDTPLAAAFVAIRNQDTRAQGATALLDLGEVDAALLPLKDQLNYGEYDLAIDLLEHPNLPEHADHLSTYAMALKATSQGNAASTARSPLAYKLEWNIMAALEGDPPRTLSQEALSVVPKVTALEPFAAICATHCPDTQAICTYSLGLPALINSGPTAVTSSPVQTIITNTEYQQSARFETDIKRHIQATDLPWLDEVNLDSCAATYVSN